jgi:hypothetical protein
MERQVDASVQAHDHPKQKISQPLAASMNAYLSESPQTRACIENV